MIYIDVYKSNHTGFKRLETRILSHIIGFKITRLDIRTYWHEAHTHIYSIYHRHGGQCNFAC